MAQECVYQISSFCLIPINRYWVKNVIPRFNGAIGTTKNSVSAEWVKIVKDNFHRQPMNLRLIEIRTKKEKFNIFNFRGWNKKWRQSKKTFLAQNKKKTFLHLFSTFCLFSVTEAGLGWGIFGAMTTCQKSSHRAAACRLHQIFNNLVSYSLKLCTVFALTLPGKYIFSL